MAKRYKIIAKSRTYGDQEVLLDRQDYLLFKDQTICVQYSGRKTKRFYAVLVYPGRKLKKLHRVILGLTDPKQIVDHINGDSLDNRRCNLRVTNARGNRLNTRKMNRKSASRFIGVYFEVGRGKWVAKLKSHGRTYFGGRYETEEAAAIAYNILALKHHGPDVYLNTVFGVTP